MNKEKKKVLSKNRRLEMFKNAGRTNLGTPLTYPDYQTDPGLSLFNFSA